MDKYTLRNAVTIKGSTDRTFGLVFSVFFALVAFFPMIGGGAPRSWSLIVAGVFLLLALVVPSVLAPANRLWMKFGELIHRIVSPAALGIVFYVTVLPIGLIMQLFGKDPLRLRLDPQAESYWIKREPAGPEPESFDNQF